MDSAFKSAPFASYTTGQLMTFIMAGNDRSLTMIREIARRTEAEAGKVEVMTDGERLRFRRTGKAR